MTKPNPKNKGLKRWLPRPIRRAVKEQTAGGIIWRRNAQGKVEFLMIQDAKNRWTLPKGHVEPGERDTETALREIKEETGLAHTKITGWLGKINFQYRRGDALVLMATNLYLVEVTDGSDKLQKEKWMHSIGWFGVAETLDLIEYDDMHKLILPVGVLAFSATTTRK